MLTAKIQSVSISTESYQSPEETSDPWLPIEHPSKTDQTAQMSRLIWIFAVSACQLVPYSGIKLNYSDCEFFLLKISSMEPLRAVPYGMENHFYHIRWSPLIVTIFIIHAHNLYNGCYANVICLVLKMWLCCLLITSTYSNSLPTKFYHGSKQYEPWPGSILYAILTTKENMQTWEQIIKLWLAGKGINALENEQIGICNARDSLYKCIESPWSH